MYAIVEYKGQQIRVAKDAVLKVPYLAEFEEGSQLEMSSVLLLQDDQNNITIGQPVVEGVLVKAEVLEHGKDRKIIVFRKKRRKGFARKQGHRQRFTRIKITDIQV
ncbi:MAG: 50S ribosomal protein L21 [Candidatus Cloacimonetes bacterium]|nr:50S ribosomal protein L21 [Candidatus Cloacimonadota bacterium]